MKLEIKAFGGVAPKQNPRLLPADGAQIAVNCEAVGGTVKPIRGTQAVTNPYFVNTSTPAGAKTIYRFGQDEPGEAQYWLAWNTQANVCRSQVAGDKMEWTFYSANNSYPKMFNTVSKGDSANHWRLGIPAPYGDPEDSSKPTQRVTLSRSDSGPTIFLSETDWSKFTTTEGVRIYFVDERTTFNNGDDTPKSREIESIDVTFSPTDTIDFYTVKNKLQNAYFKRGKTIVANSAAKTIAIVANTSYAYFTMYLSWGGYREYFEQVKDLSNKFFDEEKDQYTGYIPEGSATGAAVTPGWRAFKRRYGFALLVYLRTSHYPGPRRYSSYRVTVDLDRDGTAATIGTMAAAIENAGLDLALTANNTDGTLFLTYKYDYANDGANPYDMYYRWIYYVRDDAGVLSSTASQLLNEERVYAWTWICDTSKVVGMGESALVMESPPSPPSDPVKVSSTGSVVKITFPADSTAFNNAKGLNPENVKVTGKRLYRAAAGEYLLVAELPLSDTTYSDATPASFLGEALVTMDDAEAPSALRGLINLPNGMMAGYDGRDLHFCRPYVPYAWPAGYSQTLDYPIVGLGRIDTTLVALTKGVPYFIQGAAPDVMVSVKSDIEQACVAARSIVSMGGGVLFASPDGLILLTTGGSKNLTEAVFRREQWQALLGSTPQTAFHAYGHDNKYIAFHDPFTENFADGTSVTYRGFVYDLATGQLARHNLSGVTAGYQDLRNDQLFLVVNGALHKWDAGDYLPAIWRSKKFSLPQRMGFSCAQVEADGDFDGLKVAVFSDGTSKIPTELVNDLVSTRTDSRIGPRYPFRLSAKQSRDLEIQLEWTRTGTGSYPSTTTEVFNVVVAQSMSEIASA